MTVSLVKDHVAVRADSVEVGDLIDLEHCPYVSDEIAVAWVTTYNEREAARA